MDDTWTNTITPSNIVAEKPSTDVDLHCHLKESQDPSENTATSIVNCIIMSPAMKQSTNLVISTKDSTAKLY